MFNISKPVLKRADSMSHYVPIQSNNLPLLTINESNNNISILEYTTYRQPVNECSIDNAKSLTVHLRDGSSFDDVTNIISKTRYNVVIGLDNTDELLTMMLNNEVKSSNTVLSTIIQLINKIGYQKVTFNFECCSGCNGSYDNNSSDAHDTNVHFNNIHISKIVIKLVDHLLGVGSYVMFADFSFKALIYHWDANNWGACPFRNIGTIVGHLNIKYPLEETKKSQFGQLASLASMAIPEMKNNMEDISIVSMTVSSMPSTLVYDIHTEIDPNITLYVHSVMPNTTDIKYRFNLSTAHGSTNLTGLPIHSVVNFANRTGVMILSNIHFKELVDIDADINKVIDRANMVFGKQRSEEIKQELLSAVTQEHPKMVRALTSSYVAEITNGSDPINRKPKKYKTKE